MTRDQDPKQVLSHEEFMTELGPKLIEILRQQGLELSPKLIADVPSLAIAFARFTRHINDRYLPEADRNFEVAIDREQPLEEAIRNAGFTNVSALEPPFRSSWSWQPTIRNIVSPHLTAKRLKMRLLVCESAMSTLSALAMIRNHRKFYPASHREAVAFATGHPEVQRHGLIRAPGTRVQHEGHARHAVLGGDDSSRTLEALPFDESTILPAGTRYLCVVGSY